MDADQPPDNVPVTQHHHAQHLLILDADVLLQLFICEEIRLLVFLQRTFQVRFAVTESVEVEIRRSRKFQARFTKELQKAIDHETIIVIEPRTLASLVSADPHTMYDSIQTLGAKYERSGLDYGEAYTYASALVLDAVVVSNDMRAVNVAQRKGLLTPKMLARFFDIVVVCHQACHLTTAECDDIRKVLSAANEGFPLAFANTSFQNGLSNFYPRLMDGLTTVTAGGAPASSLDVQLVLSRR